MARVARREPITIETAAVNDIHHITEQHDIVAGCNTDALGRLRVPASCCCVANACAMWRWSPKARFMPSTGQLMMVGAGDEWIPAKGFCGLAGTPANL